MPCYNVQHKEFSLNKNIFGEIFTPSSYAEHKMTIIFYHGWFSSIQRQRFKASILASCGYRVIVPEVVGHGDRGKYDDAGTMGLLKYFWPTVEQSIDEFSTLLTLCDEDRAICVMGHSMGGFITAGLLASYPFLSSGVSFNGCATWRIAQEQNFRAFLQAGGTEEEFYSVGGSYTFDPAEKLHQWMHIPYLMTNGKNDKVVSPKGNIHLIKKALELNNDTKFEHHIMSETGHLITEEMLHLSVKFLAKHLFKQFYGA